MSWWPFRPFRYSLGRNSLTRDLPNESPAENTIKCSAFVHSYFHGDSHCECGLPLNIFYASSPNPYVEIVKQWLSAYPEDIFPPDGTSVDCISSKMARHICKRLLEQFEAIK